MNTTLILAVAFVLFLVALPLISFGAMEEMEALWWAGLALLAVAGILPPVTRFIGADDDDKGADDDKADDDKADDDKPDDDKLDDDKADGGRPEDDRKTARRTYRPSSSDHREQAGAPGHPRAADPPPPGRIDREPPRVAEQRERAADLASDDDAGEGKETEKENGR
jgi:hypothetical protein